MGHPTSPASILNPPYAIRERLVTTRRLQLQQRKIIEQGLSYLVEASARFGKKDWFNLALGTVLSIVVTNALPTLSRPVFPNLPIFHWGQWGHWGQKAGARSPSRPHPH